ncbi:uncharacterized protein MELLADRAFT_113998 [Melampsora larici-populina 98AG31]|uniref:Uncharacterized protein n=1 Tax=Melampsora larici-populina (strain 98AG31 / pathotype 3-4-7) TaxID=747676 RepID=F4SBT1_MELLP|nr:uncharacterized protein MELLADRAFT_113998 [Melampsora larici-populina 98AG31]EGF97897.1 hypothetical protein MELLADRAFT_113998 [Melampsora larici-populina 98AG31]
MNNNITSHEPHKDQPTTNTPTEAQTTSDIPNLSHNLLFFKDRYAITSHIDQQTLPHGYRISIYNSRPNFIKYKCYEGRYQNKQHPGTCPYYAKATRTLDSEEEHWGLQIQISLHDHPPSTPPLTPPLNTSLPPPPPGVFKNAEVLINTSSRTKRAKASATPAKAPILASTASSDLYYPMPGGTTLIANTYNQPVIYYSKLDTATMYTPPFFTPPPVLITPIVIAMVRRNQDVSVELTICPSLPIPLLNSDWTLLRDTNSDGWTGLYDVNCKVFAKLAKGLRAARYRKHDESRLRLGLGDPVHVSIESDSEPDSNTSDTNDSDNKTEASKTTSEQLAD